MDRVIGGRRYRFELDGAEPDAGVLVELQVDAFLVPHAARIVDLLEEGGVRVPEPVVVRLTTSADRPDPATWHTTLAPGEASGMRLAERTFVQALLAASPPSDLATAHHRACTAITAVVDETFICALEILRGPC